MINSYLKNKMPKEEDDISSDAEEAFEVYVVDREKYKIPPSTETKLLAELDRLDTAARDLLFDTQKKETKDRIKKVKDLLFEHKRRDRETIDLLHSILREYKSIKGDLSWYPSNKAEKGEKKKDENNG